MPNSLNFYRDAHKMADRAIEQAQEVYETVRSDPDTETRTGVTRRNLRGIVVKRTFTRFLSVPSEYYEAVKDALAALYDARAVVRFMIHHPNMPGQTSRDRFQSELENIERNIQSMNRLKRVMSTK